MKRYILLCCCFLSLLLACKKYLDVKPKSQIRENLLLENEKGFMDALAGVYTLMARKDLYGDELTMSFLDVLAQRYKVPRQTSAYWDAAHYNYNSNQSKLPVKNTIRSIWLSSYTAIANVNNILGNIESRQALFTGDNYNLVKGEALGLRAFLHFDLLRLFGPVMINNSFGNAIPYRIKLSKEAQSPIAANEVVELILKDLLDAEELLKNDPVITGAASDLSEFQPEYRKFRMNYYAVQATLARVYQYNNQPEKAYEYAKRVIATEKYPFVSSLDISTTGACRDRTFHNEQVFALLINNMKPYTDEYFATTPGTYENTVLTNDNAIIDEVFDHSSTDYRRQYLWESREGQLLHSKFWQFESIPDQCSAWPKNVMPLLRISEMYYIAAESSTDLNESIDLMNEVLSHRGLDPLTGITDQSELKAAITKEYQKEFFSEGQLFYYYKRNNFLSIPGSPVPADDKVYVLPIPEDESIF